MLYLIVHDEVGFVLDARAGDDLREPVGVPFIYADVPEGKKVKDGIGVDVSVTPHQVILEDIPKSETQLLNERLEATEQALLQIMLEGMK